jgi:hypothetical protein
MLDGIERRRFLVDPAREDPLPAPVGALHVELHESTGELLELPRRRRLARPQPHHCVLHSDRLARPDRQVADDAVALVEQAQNGDPLRHRRHPSLVGGGARHGRARHPPLLRRRSPLGLALFALAAGAGKCHGQRADQPSAHAQSGVQGW